MIVMLPLLSHFSRVWLCATPETAAHQAFSWDSPGKNTGVGCHFLLQCMKVKSESEVTQLCPTLSDPIDSSLPGSSVHGIFQAGVLEWVSMAFSDDCNYKVFFCILFVAQREITLTLKLWNITTRGFPNARLSSCLLLQNIWFRVFILASKQTYQNLALVTEGVAVGKLSLE